MNNEMKECLTQLEEKIAQLIQVVFELAILSTQAPTTSVAKLSPISRDQDLSFSKEDQD